MDMPAAWAQAAVIVAAGYVLRMAGLVDGGDVQASLNVGAHIMAPAVVLQSFLGASLPYAAWGLATAAAAVLLFLSTVAMWAVCKTRHPAQRALLLGCSCGGLTTVTAMPVLHICFGSTAVQLAAISGLITAIGVHAGSYLLCSASQSAYPKNYRHEDGGMYDGQWQGKNKQGLGVYRYPGGAKYEGEWRNNFKEGRGVYTFPKGGSYEGEWRGGDREGMGIRTMRSGKVLAGRWEQGELAVAMEEWQCALAAETAHHAALAARRVPVGQGEAGIALQQVITSPVLLATLAGILLRLFQLPIPPTVQGLTSILAVPFAPVMLLTFGASLQLKPIPANQWQDACQVAAARYVPPLLLLPAALLAAPLPNMPAGAVAVVSIAAACLLSPVPTQVLEYARRFNLSASLAGSISNLCAWLSSTLLLTITAVVAHAKHTLTTAQPTASLPQLIAAVRGQLLAVSISAAALLLISVPVSANLAKKSRMQGPQHLQAPAAGRSKVTSAGVPAETPSSGASNLAAPGSMENPVPPDGEARQGKAVGGPTAAASGVGTEGPAQRPDEDTMSEPSTLPSSHSFASEADSPPQTLSEMIDKGEGESAASSSINDGQAPPEEQLPSTSSEAGADRKKGFFRDIDSDCVPTCRQRHLAIGPKFCEFGRHRIAGMQRPRIVRRRMHRASCLTNGITCRRILVLAT